MYVHGLLQEAFHITAERKSKAEILALAKIIGSYPKGIQQVLSYMKMESKSPSPSRKCVSTPEEYASWLFRDVANNDPKGFQSILGNFLQYLSKCKSKTILRNLLGTLEDQFPKSHKYHGLIYDMCISLAMDESNALAVRAFSIGNLVRIVHIHPELREETLMVLEERYKNSTEPSLTARMKLFYKKPKG
jgi:hypothetical protein